MTIGKVSGLYAVELGAADLGAIMQQGVQTDTQLFNDTTSGLPEVRFQALQSQKPRASFATLAIKKFIDTIALQGASIADLVGGLNLFGQRHKDGSTRDATAIHRKLSIVKGLLAPRQLTMPHQDNATITAEAIVTHDGSANLPIIVTDGVTLPTVPADDERYSLGPVTLGGIALDELRSVELDFGINAVAESADGNVWDTFVSIRTIRPSLVLRGLDLEMLKEAGGFKFEGSKGIHTNTSFYLRKRAAGATYVTDATAAHIKFTGDGMIVVEEPQSVGSPEDVNETTVRMFFQHDGTTAPLTVDTAIAIP